MFSSFRRLDERPPAVTNVSMGTPFEFDVEKGMELESGHQMGGKFRLNQ